MWYGTGSGDQYQRDLERLNHKLKRPTPERLEAMRKQCGRNCPCQEQGINCILKGWEWLIRHDETNS